ncbi:hypothetical protein B0G81_2888 [Paraburkholderia sp. BL6665CI2N2]|uniref:PIN domain-containing protein n=1 Tax=Paraburkholderia sp. BL6665CI2N2 TaxID=1938806 RepID=UPI0010658F0E|nr:PIN domain-containing protein [Paraburkholderia sp. BL6665CI2N2]TDY22577.1 hypothetical protein B0G81_2888 [Paraburkholderia sp. BL6665CI2N2]
MPQLNLFIDTNIFLNFYHYTNDDTGVINSLIERIAEEKIVLHLPQQVSDEWERNREVKLSTAANEFSKITFPDTIPRHMHGLASADLYKQAVEQAKKARNHLVAEATVKARTYGLEVDAMLNLLFEAATKYPHDLAIFELGTRRAKLGNPTGKSGSVGDQYNWEMLLSKVPADDLYIVTKDGDYVSALGGTDENGGLYANAFLKREWSSRKGGKNLYIFQNLKSAITYLTKLTVAGAPANLAEEPQPVPNEPAPNPAQVEDVPVVAPVQPEGQAVPQHIGEAVIEPEPQAAGVMPGPVPTPDQEAAKNAAIDELVDSPNFAMTHIAIANLRPYSQFFTVADANRLFEAAFDNRQINWIITDDDVNEFYLKLLGDFFASLDPDVLDNAIELLGLRPDDEDHHEAASS